MRRLIFLILLAAIAWYGWHHYGDLRSGPSNIAVIQNSSGHPIERVRLIMADQTLVKEVIADGATVEIPFRLAKDSGFQLHWQWGDKVGEMDWTGGSITAGPVVTRQHFTVMGDGGVIWSAEVIPPGTK